MHVFQLTAILMDEARPGYRRVEMGSSPAQCSSRGGLAAQGR